MKGTRAFLIVGSVMHGLAYIFAASEHVVDVTWPWHARFHLLQAIFWVVGFNVLVALVAWRLDLAKDRVLALAVFGGAFLMLHASYFLSIAAMPAGMPPGVFPHAALLVVGTIYGVGLLRLVLRRA